MGSGPGPVALMGREVEQQRVGTWVRTLAAFGSPGPLVMHGAAGMGKTALWRVAVDAADAVGGTVLASRPDESELSLGYGGLSDLLSPHEARWAPVLPPHLTEALATALMLAPANGVDDRLAVYRGAQLALEAVARAGAFTVVALDDVQWLDPASAGALSYALRRWSAGPIGLVVTWRTGLEEPLGVHTVLGEPEAVEVGPLPRDQLDRLVSGRAETPLSAARLDTIARISGGNPFYAIELARAGGDVEVPATLSEAAARRLRSARTAGRSAIELAAVCAPAPYRLFVEQGFVAALDVAVEDGILLVEDDGASVGQAVRFDHPLLAWAAYHQLGPGLRRRLHRDAAARAVTVEERATHVARATDEPNDVAAALLDSAAGAAAKRHAIEAAAAFAREAARLTSPANREDLTRRLVDMAWWRTEWQPVEASQAADLALSPGVTGHDRGRVLVVKKETAKDWESYFHWSGLASAEPGLDASLVADLRSDTAWMSGALRGGDLQRACREAQRALREASDCQERVRVGCVAALGSLLSLAGDPRAESLFERGLVLARLGVRPSNGKHVRVLYAIHLAGHGLWERATEQLDDEEQHATEDGNDGLLALVNWTRAWLELTHGDVVELDRRLAALEVTSLRSGFYRDFWAKTTAVVQARRGDPACLDTVRDNRAVSFDALVLGPDGLAGHCRGLLLVAQGQPELAAPSFDALARTIPRSGVLRSELLSHLPEAVTAMVAAGRLNDADALIRTIDDPARDEPLGTVLEELCRGLVQLGSGAADAAERLGSARVRAEQIEARWLVAHAAYAQGLALRRRGLRAQARDALEVAAGLFGEMRAPPWAQRAAEAARSAVPHRSDDQALTAGETRVAELAAIGMRNAEIAARLFVSVATVETHLTRAYRKLGVRSRVELAAHLG